MLSFRLTCDLIRQWARARAIRDAYQADIMESMDTIPLTYGDVYQWLEDEDQFPRPFKGAAAKNPQPPAKKVKGTSSQLISPTLLCSICGLNHQHNTSPTETESATRAPSCSLVHDDTGWHKMSMSDVRRFIGLPSRPMSDQLLMPHFSALGKGVNATEPTPTSRFLSSNRDLVAIASPELVKAMKKLIRPLSLSRFEQESSEFLLEKSKAQLEAELAPYALIDRKSTRLNSSHDELSRMPSSA